MALTDFLCLITENIIAIPVIDANIPQRQIQFILFCFYVITKERLDIEFIALNCSINQKTHNNMSINVFLLSHQVGTICDTHVQVIHAFPPKVPLCNPALHPASVPPLKQADYTGTSYDDGDNRDAKSHPSADMPGLFLTFNFVAEFNDSTTF